MHSTAEWFGYYLWQIWLYLWENHPHFHPVCNPKILDHAGIEEQQNISSTKKLGFVMNLHIIARGMKTDLTMLLNVFQLVAILCNVAWYPHLFPYLECLTTNHVEALGGFTTIGKNILLWLYLQHCYYFYLHIYESKRKCVRERRCDGYEYRSKRDCISHCKTNPPTQITNSDICHLPPMRPEFKGVECRASIPKWTYSTRFVWFSF